MSFREVVSWSIFFYFIFGLVYPILVPRYRLIKQGKYYWIQREWFFRLVWMPEKCSKDKEKMEESFRTKSFLEEDKTIIIKSE